MSWATILDARALAPGAIAPIDDDWIVWRTRTGALGTLPRRCPHMDFDLLDGTVAGEELVCTGHGWCFDVDGHAGKRNVLGRLDAKDDVVTRAVREREGHIEVAGVRR
jgi:phenylpropionate dioxygenase-like ring-hydroxylating dioxygenase large terminal subunit